jgi:hypothetical protein
MAFSPIRLVWWSILGLALWSQDLRAATAHSLPRIPPAAQRAALPERVFRFVLLGPLSTARTAAAVIVEISDDRWTARELGMVEVLLPGAATPELAARGGVALWNAALARFEAIGLEP